MDRCDHGPNVRCLKCMARDAQKAAELKKKDLNKTAQNPSNSTKLSSSSSQQGEKVYTVGGGVKKNASTHFSSGVYRLGDGGPIKPATQTAKGKPVKWLCNHPPGQKCSNCLCPKGAANVKRQCNHPPTMKCPNCIAPEEVKPNQPQQPRIYFPATCPNHGPHGCCTLCLAKWDYEKVRIQKQEAVCKLCRMNFMETDNFQRYVFQRSFYVNRIGILYGTFKQDRVQVEAIYEPPQVINEEGDFEMKQEQTLLQVQQMAVELGLERVGIIFSHARREEILTSREIISAAQRQLDWDKRCVTVVVTPNETGSESKVECYQASEQLMELVKKAIVQPSQPKNNEINLKESVYLSQKEIMTVDPIVFVCNVPIRAFKAKTMFLSSKYPIENRPQEDVTLLQFKKYFESVKTLPIYQQISDFHLLVFCLDYGVFSSLHSVKECIVNKIEKHDIKEDIKQWLEMPLD
ncbi:NPL4 family protein [Entamoeba histolytica HM-1:IMSS-B]|uniref:MPN domain-containing protein n=6 Tax=Entamoeba histolytica TaxID=5759 RepID=C4M5W5_ENTH1|nr:hypothetical protein EHI_026450 [Entamoeba histolytica HM-1:IMSS]EMD42922.1 nuclear protein localization, putative [Entamoeba histolytica KU27]EMH75244.1 NPL4 family protein [Entamoeba histolytica HM-1:IMSS-B]EMS17689.1 nuclear protein localization, putative [Entamoeba histolytica HM-3:IMSS]ENY63125.1 nuclear protein localization, putative [Entamoeba histolytica HM-1:IMSS-A]GAT96834.1 hypothetical protein CL6EHI_026450 [Entamoeba histolytica]|eukprot:XP_655374.1 hypothetical protein EHI_026450 [Entamoeba histolytica HM-1:IMSS]